MERTLGRALVAQAEAHPSHLAWTCQGRSEDYGTLDATSSKVAHALLAAGVTRGSRVALLAKNDGRYFDLLYAAAKVGAVLVAINWRLAPPEIEYILSHSGATVLVVGDDFTNIVDGVRGRLPEIRSLISLEGAATNYTPFDDWCGPYPDVAPPVDVREEDAVVQMYTSGTTGLPKGAVISHRYFYEAFQMILSHPSRHMAFAPDDVVLVTMPLFHIGGAMFAFMGMHQGATVMVMREFDVKELLRLINGHNIPSFSAVPTMLQAILDHADAAHTDFSRVRMLFYGAAPMPPALLERAMKTIGCQFAQTYGMTEHTAVTVLGPEDHDPNGNQRMLSVGRPLRGIELKIMGPDGATLAVGEVGEIAIRSRSLMSGYWRDADATASAMTADGFFRTGDAAQLDEDGYVYLKDRIKDMIVSGGENVYPAEVENALYSHPSVEEVAVVGVADERWGEVPKAFIVLRPGASLDVASLSAHAQARIARYKVPKHFEAVAELPRNASGKVLRRVLRG